MKYNLEVSMQADKNESNRLKEQLIVFADLQFCPAPLATKNPRPDEKSSNAMALGCDCNEENRALGDYFLYTTDKNRIFIKISCNFCSNLL